MHVLRIEYVCTTYVKFDETKKMFMIIQVPERYNKEKEKATERGQAILGGNFLNLGELKNKEYHPLDGQGVREC